MKKKFSKFICSLTMVLLLSNTALAMDNIKLPQDFNEKVIEEIKLYVNNKTYKVGDIANSLEIAPYIKENSFMISVDFIGELVGLQKENMTWDDENNRLTIFKDNHIIQVSVGSDLLIVDGKKIKMNTGAEIKEGAVILPLKSIAKAMDLQTKYNSITKTGTISIEKEQKKQVGIWDYTYEDLLAMALKNSRDLKTSNMDVERTEIVKDNASDDSRFTPLAGSLSGPGELLPNAAYLKFSRADFEFQLSKKVVEKIKDKVAYDTKNAYYQVLKSEDNKKIAKLAMDLMGEKAHLMDLNNREGFVSDIEKRQTQRDYQEAKKQYALTEKELEKAYEKLNDLVGLDVKARYILKDEILFEKGLDKNPDGHIARVTQESPDIWALKKMIDLKDLNVNLHVFNLNMTTKWSFGIEPYDAKEIDTKMAEVKLGKAKQKYDQSLRELHKTLNQLKDQYEKEKISYEKAKDDFKMVKLNVEVGNELPITEKKAALQVENAKKQLREKMMTYNTAVMIYEKPWIMTQKKEKKEEK